MGSTKSIIFALPAGLGVLLAAASAAAQNPAPPTAAPQLQEVVVTADRRQENIQRVPIQVTALSSQDITNATARTTQDVLNVVPNVIMAHSQDFLNSFVVIRGIQEINNADSPLSIIVDGVPQNNIKEAFLDLLDVAQVQVLRGPQGGLYGRNAIGGAMIITTRQPTNTLEGFARLDYGNGDAYEATGGISGPLVPDHLLFRVATDISGFGGLIKNDYLARNVDYIDHNDTIQGSLLALPSEWLTIELRARYNTFTAGSQEDAVAADSSDFASPSSDLLGQSSGHIGNSTLKMDANMGFATLTSITGYTDLKELFIGDLDFTNLIENPGGFDGLGPLGQGQNLTDKEISQELRLVSPNDRSLRWVAGAYYLHEDRDLETVGFLDPDHNRDEYYDPALTIIDRAETDHNYAWALYGQADYDLTRALTVTGAFRYDSDHRDQLNPATGLTRTATFDRPQPKVTLSYRFDRDRLVYGTFSTGFRSGGFNAPGVMPEQFAAESLRNYEVGFKSSWFDRRFIVNGDVYYATDHDYQFFYVDAVTVSQVIGNIDSVRIRGVELESQWAVTRGLDVFGGLGTTNTRIERSTEFTGIDGNHTPKTIPWKLDVGVQYQRPLRDGLDGFLRVDYEHRASEYWQVDNVDVQRPLDLLNARVGVKKGRIGLYLWGKNLTDTRYFEDFNPAKFTGEAYDLGWRAEPRTYGVELSGSF